MESAVAQDTELLSSFFKSSGIDGRLTDNYEYVIESGAHVYTQQINDKRIRSDIVVIYYKDANRLPILDSGIPYKRIRIVNEDASESKYLSPLESTSHIYIPMSFTAAVSDKDYIVITEGEKKADAASQAGIPTLALTGIHAWADPLKRKAEKDEASELLRKSPRLSEDTPIHPELVDIIKRFNIKRVVVLFDSDGESIEKDFIPKSDIRSYYKEGKGLCKNKKVRAAARVLSTAIAKQIGIGVHWAFCEVKVTETCNSKIIPINKSVKVESIVKNGLDDWILLDGASYVRKKILSMVQLCSIPVYLQEPDYVPLGYSSEGRGVYVYIWNKAAQTVLSSSIGKLSQDTAIIELLGPAGAERFIEIKENGEVRYNKLKVCKALYDECVGEGREWDPHSNARGSGVWVDGDSLIVNAKELTRIDESGRRTVERCSLDNNRIVYPKPARGLTITDIPSASTVRESLVRLISNLNTFSWGNSFDTFIMAGWMLLQSYTGAIHRRPHVYIYAESGAGKTTLNEYVHGFLNDVSVFVESGTDTTAAGIRQYMGVHSGVMIIDEMDRTEDVLSGKRHDNTQAILQSMRAAYSTILDEDSQYRISSLKGTASGKAQSFSSAVSYMLTSVSVPELQQADANRMLMLTINKNKSRNSFINDEDAKKDGIIIRNFMLQYDMWTEFSKNADYVFSMLGTDLDDRQKWTLSMPLAALITVSGRVGIMTDNVSTVIQGCLEGYKCSKAAEDSTPEHEKIWHKLLLSSVKVEIVQDVDGGLRTSTITDTLKNILVKAIKADGWQDKRRTHQGPFIDVCKRHQIIYQNINDKEYIFISAHCDIEVNGVKISKYKDILGQNPLCDKPAVAKIDGIPVRGIRMPINASFYDVMDDIFPTL